MKTTHQMKITRLICITLALINSSSHTGSIRLYGNAQIARSTYHLTSQVTGSQNQNGIVSEVETRLTSQQPLSQSDPDDILQGPGAITVDSKDSFKLEVAGHPDKKPKSIKGSQIKFLANEDQPNSSLFGVPDVTASLGKTVPL